MKLYEKKSKVMYKLFKNRVELLIVCHDYLGGFDLNRKSIYGFIKSLCLYSNIFFNINFISQ